MKILFVDDMDERWIALMKVIPDRFDRVILRANNAKEAKALLDGPATFDVVLLDHDLGDQHYNSLIGGCDDECGCAIVDCIINRRMRFGNTIFVCHSMNYHARTKMVARLKDQELTALDVPWPLPLKAGWR